MGSANSHATACGWPAVSVPHHPPMPPPTQVPTCRAPVPHVGRGPLSKIHHRSAECGRRSAMASEFLPFLRHGKVKLVPNFRPVTQCLPVLEAPDSVLAPSWLSHQDLTVFQFLGLPCLHYQPVTCLTPKPLVRVDSPPHHTIGKHPATELSPPLRIALTQHNRALTPSSDPPVLRL